MKYVYIITILVLLVFIAFFLKLISPSKDTQPRVLSEISEADLQEVIVDNESGRLRLMKIDGEWFVFDDGEKKPVFLAYTESMIQGLLSLRPTYSFVSEDTIENYGLDPAKIEISVRTKDGGVIELFIGNIAPTGRESYLLKNNEDKIYMIPYEKTDVWERAAAVDFKLRNVLPVTLEKVKDVKISISDLQYRFERSDGRIMLSELTGRGGKVVDVEPQLFVALLESINYLSIKNIIPVKKEELGFYEFSLEYPTIEIEVQKKDGSKKSLSISVYANHYLFGIEKDPPGIKVIEPETVDQFVELFEGIVKTDFGPPNIPLPQNRQMSDDSRLPPSGGDTE